jgi:hypothetical protein
MPTHDLEPPGQELGPIPVADLAQERTHVGPRKPEHVERGLEVRGVLDAARQLLELPAAGGRELLVFESGAQQHGDELVFRRRDEER